MLFVIKTKPSRFCLLLLFRSLSCRGLRSSSHFALKCSKTCSRGLCFAYVCTSCLARFSRCVGLRSSRWVVPVLVPGLCNLRLNLSGGCGPGRSWLQVWARSLRRNSASSLRFPRKRENQVSEEGNATGTVQNWIIRWACGSNVALQVVGGPRRRAVPQYHALPVPLRWVSPTKSGILCSCAR